MVDEYCRTSDPHIWAAGDCARHPSIHYGMRVRLESVDNAFEQGTSAALNMLGSDYRARQGAVVLVGPVRSQDGDRRPGRRHDRVVVRGDPASRAFSVCYLKGGELIAVETVNHIKDQMAARKLIPARARPDPAKLANDAIALKDC